LTVVKVKAGACGFVTRIRADKVNKREVKIEIESDCESVDDLGFILQEIGPLSLKDIVSKGANGNRVFHAAAEKLPHSACPVSVAVLKACEVELGLAVPRPVSIEFECDSEDQLLS
jgi:hypothetical protein